MLIFCTFEFFLCKKRAIYGQKFSWIKINYLLCKSKMRNNIIY